LFARGSIDVRISVIVSISGVASGGEEVVKSYYGTGSNPWQIWNDFLAFPPSKIAIDTETVSIRDQTCLGIGVAISPHDTFYLDMEDPDLHKLIKILQDPKITSIYHNAPFDLRTLRPWKVDYSNIEDTAVMARLANVGAVLAEAAFYVGKPVPTVKSTMIEYGVTNMRDLPFNAIALKCQVDADATYAISEYFPSRINQDYYQIERRVISLCEEISQRGVKLDQERVSKLDSFYGREESYYRNVAEGLGFSPSKNFEVGYMLSERGVYLPFTKGKTMLATDEKNLRKIMKHEAIPYAQLTLLYRRAAKQRSTFIKPFKGADRAYTTLHLDASTGRISGTNAGITNPDRNLLNITKRADQDKPKHLRVRSQFIPDLEVFTLADDSQVEMRILAYLSKDKRMLEVFASGGDIHADTEMGIWETKGINRLAAKIFNYAMLYGADVWTVAENIGTGDIDRVRKWMMIWQNTYPQAFAWRIRTANEASISGYITTMYGRKISIPLDRGMKHASNCAMNFPIQGSAAEIFKRTLLEFGSDTQQLLLPIHDERMFNGRVEMPEGLEDLSPLHIPISVKYVDRWE